MDPERQPLLSPGMPEVRYRRYRPLTYEEVQATRQEVTWSRTRFLLLLMFWGIVAMFIAIITCILVQAPKCSSYVLGPVPTVPPVHMTLAPLVATVRDFNEDSVYTM